MNDSDSNNLSPASNVSYTLKIEEELNQRLESLIQLLNHSEDTRFTKQRWIVDAFLEKLKKGNEEVLQDPPPPKKKHLHFSINQHLYGKIEEKVDVLKKTHKNYTKNMWFISAVNEKLEREENKSKELLKKFKSLSLSRKR